MVNRFTYWRTIRSNHRQLEANQHDEYAERAGRVIRRCGPVLK